MDQPYLRRLDEDLFPELQFGPGREGIRAMPLAQTVDRRVPASPRARVLLVVFRLVQPDPSTALSTDPHGWHLSFERGDAQGRLHRERIAVVPEPQDGNVSKRARPDTGPTPAGRAIYRGAWWTDLAGLYADGTLRAGMAMEVGYAGQGSVIVTMT